MKSKNILKKVAIITSVLTVPIGSWALNFTSTFAATCSPSQAFKMVVKTDNPGTSSSTSFTIPTTGTGYSYRVDINGDNDWADTSAGSGWNETTNRTGSSTINFGSAGTYTIAICGSFPRIYFNNGGDRRKLLDITQWGDNQWSSMQMLFMVLQTWT